MFKLYYHVVNTGDGCVRVCFHPTLEVAQETEASEREPFAEETAAALTLKIMDGNIFRLGQEWDGEKWTEVWEPLERTHEGNGSR